MFPSSDMNGNAPVRSLYSIPVHLLANAAKQNIFASDETLSVSIMLVLLGRGGTGDTLEWLIEILSALQGLFGTNDITLACSSFCLVLRMPIRGRFMWTLAVAGLGLRYLVTQATLRFGHPFKKPCLIALSKVEMWGLHKD
jgi:hypothetical protein